MTKRIEKKKSKKVEDASLDVINKLTQKLNALEAQIMERDAKLNEIDAKQKNSAKGSQQFGVSEWSDWENGAEKGYHRKMYVDIRQLITPRAM